MKNIRLTIAILLSFSAFLYAQENNAGYFQAYAETVQGKHFTYHSAIPKVNQCLLLRGRADYKPLEWKTEVLPKNYQSDYVNFIWAYGMDVTSDPVKFHLYVNNWKWISFESSNTSKTGISNIKGENGAELKFNSTMLDIHNDQMGFATLRLPTEWVNLGESNRIRIEAEHDDNNAWFMVFKAQVRDEININQNHVVVKDAGNLWHSVSVDFIHVGDNTDATVNIGSVNKRINLKAGFNKLDINLPKVNQPTELVADIIVGNEPPQKVDFTIEPIREWEIFLVQHTHTDIGYTRPQTEILPEHLRYIDHALDFCDQTDDYPDAAKFRWTCETSWSVREYLRSRPKEQIDRLLKRLQEGRIEATGMFFNFSEIIDEPALAAQTKVLRMLKNQGIDVTTAMQNDVNGIAWCLVDYFNNTDVKYLSMGIHAHRARKPFNKPTSFWWQSPAGNRILAYRSEHYQHGNGLSLTRGKQDVFRNNLSDYLRSLEQRDYPYNKVALQFSGYLTDNSPPSTKACDIIRAWNEKYEWPKLRSSLARDFLVYLDEHHSNEIEEKEVAWPDWWTDGVGSAANETKVARQTHVEIASSTALLSMAKILGAKLPDPINKEVEEVYDNLLFYDEHTHGAAESVSDPLSQNTINQWNMKSSYVWGAANKSSTLQEKSLAFLEPYMPKSDKATIAVFNTLGWKRSGLVELFIQNEVIPSGVDFTIKDADGNKVPAQATDYRSEGAYYSLWVKDIPAFGYKTLQVNIGESSLPLVVPSDSELFENDFYKITLDEKKGIVTQIFDKQLKKILIDPKDTLSLGQVIYEELGNRHELERLTSQNRDTVYRPIKLKRSTLSNIKVEKVRSGPLYKSILINGQMPVCADDRGIDIEIRLYHFEKKIEFLYRMIKLPVHSPEGVYVAFPFKLEDGHLAFEAQGGIVRPGINQLEGSAADWNTIQNFAQVKNDNAQIIFSSDEIPLVHFGDINIGRYYYRLKPKTNHIYSWVLNNYWVTNFKASQSGELRWSYAITSSENTSTTFASEFGRNHRTPLPSRVIFPKSGQVDTKLVARSLFNFEIPNLLLVDARPSLNGKGVVLHFREIQGGHAVLDVNKILEETGASSIQEVNVLEERLGTPKKRIKFGHFETKFIKLEFE